MLLSLPISFIQLLGRVLYFLRHFSKALKTFIDFVLLPLLH